MGKVIGTRNLKTSIHGYDGNTVKRKWTSVTQKPLYLHCTASYDFVFTGADRRLWAQYFIILSIQKKKKKIMTKHLSKRILMMG